MLARHFRYGLLALTDATYESPLDAGALYQAEFGLRMKGEGPIAQLLGARFSAAVKRLGLNKIRYRLDTMRFSVPESARTALVDAKRDARQMRLL